MTCSCKGSGRKRGRGFYCCKAQGTACSEACTCGKKKPCKNQLQLVVTQTNQGVASASEETDIESQVQEMEVLIIIIKHIIIHVGVYKLSY